MEITGLTVLALAQDIETRYSVMVGRPDMLKPLSESNPPVEYPFLETQNDKLQQLGMERKSFVIYAQYGGGLGDPATCAYIKVTAKPNSCRMLPQGGQSVLEPLSKKMLDAADNKTAVLTGVTEIISIAVDLREKSIMPIA